MAKYTMFSIVLQAGIHTRSLAAVHQPNLAESPTLLVGANRQNRSPRCRHDRPQRPARYARYHEVLNRAVWSSREAARILLVLAPAPTAIIMKCQQNLVLSVVRHSFAGPRHGYQQQGRRHKNQLGAAGHAAAPLAAAVWWAKLHLLHCCQSLREPVTLIARLRLDAALYAPAPPRFVENAPWTSRRNVGERRGWYDGTTRAVELTSTMPPVLRVLSPGRLRHPFAVYRSTQILLSCAGNWKLLSGVRTHLRHPTWCHKRLAARGRSMTHRKRHSVDVLDLSVLGQTS